MRLGRDFLLFDKNFRNGNKYCALLTPTKLIITSLNLNQINFTEAAMINELKEYFFFSFFFFFQRELSL